MKFLGALVTIFFLVGCGTAAKVQYDGDVTMREGGKKAPVLLIYKLSFKNDRHEIFFWDQDHNRFNVSVDGNYDTTKGVVIYLPAGRNYALSGFLHVLPWGRREIDLGTEELQLFHVAEGRVTQIPYFELMLDESNGAFHVRNSDYTDQDSFQEMACKEFSFLLPIKAVKAF